MGMCWPTRSEPVHVIDQNLKILEMKDVKKVVQSTYTAVIEADQSCCSTDCCTDPALQGYKDLEGYTKIADYGLGCGIPLAFEAIKPGDIVLDLGSGAGNDVFIARQQTGETGEVIGLDFTPAMLEKAEANRVKLGFENVRFVMGDIESIPLPANSIDVVISNCVLNLVPNKEQAFSEIFRVLKADGKFVISDVVAVSELPEAVQNDAKLYGSCIGGAIPKQEYMALIDKIGFEKATILEQRNYPATFEGKPLELYSITVKGEKTDCCDSSCC